MNRCFRLLYSTVLLSLCHSYFAGNVSLKIFFSLQENRVWRFFQAALFICFGNNLTERSNSVSKGKLNNVICIRLNLTVTLDWNFLRLFLSLQFLNKTNYLRFSEYCKRYLVIMGKTVINKNNKNNEHDTNAVMVPLGHLIFLLVSEFLRM